MNACPPPAAPDAATAQFFNAPFGFAAFTKIAKSDVNP